MPYSGMLEETRHAARISLSSRDRVLLPLLALATVAALCFSAEMLARAVYWETDSNTSSCYDFTNADEGAVGRPNTVCMYKMWEGPKVEYRYNGEGYRAGMEDNAKPAGTFRIVMVGSSMAMGLNANWQDTFAAKLPAQLSAITGRKVELYDEALEWHTPRNIERQFERAVRPQPDLLLWVLTAWDIEHVDLSVPGSEAEPPTGFIGRLGRRFGHPRSTLMSHSRAVLILRHWIAEDRAQYLRLYLREGENSGYLKKQLDPFWSEQFKKFAGLYCDVQRKADAAHVRLVTTFLPHRAQLAMVAEGKWGAEYDPRMVDERLRNIVERCGGVYLPMTDKLAQSPNVDAGFYPVDAHPNALGHELLTSVLGKMLAPEIEAR